MKFILAYLIVALSALLAVVYLLAASRRLPPMAAVLITAVAFLGLSTLEIGKQVTPVARTELGPDPLLAVEQACTLETDPTKAREVARRHTKRYLGLENYTNNLRRLGWGDTDLGDAGSDKLVDAIVAWGDVSAIRARADTHRKNGADHLCLQVLGDDVAGQLRVIAKALL